MLQEHCPSAHADACHPRTLNVGSHSRGYWKLCLAFQLAWDLGLSALIPYTWTQCVSCCVTTGTCQLRQPAPCIPR
jgi:hypothetical protein